MDPSLTEHENGWLLIEDGKISALGTADQPLVLDAEVIDCGGDIVMPGMVNTHTHMAMSLFRGLGEDVDDRLYRYMLPLERKFVSPEMVRVGTTLAAVEGTMGGVTTYTDMYYHETIVGEVLDGAGLRGIVGQTLADFNPPDHKDWDEGFALVDKLVDQFKGHARIIPSIAPHAPYSTGLKVMERIADWSEAHPDVPVQMHLAESDLEVRWAQETHGTTTTEVVKQSGLLKRGLICAHCLHLSDTDIENMAHAQVCVATNPRSNGKAGRGIAPVERIRAAGIPVGLGSDGPMSGNTMDLFSQMAPVSMFAKLLAGSRKPLPAVDVVKMATIDGAKVVSLDHKIGSLEVGKQADLIRVDISSPRVQPIYDIYSVIVFSSFASDVRATMVGGEWLMKDRIILKLDVKKALRDANQIATEFKAEMTAIDAGEVPY